MKALVTCAVLVVTIVGSGTLAMAQQPGHRHEGAAGPPAASAPTAPGPRPEAKHAMPMMEMCRQMMAQPGTAGATDGMGGGMMGMMPMSGDPKHHADMMAMRGEMMKAMGDIMMKYAQRMHPTR